MRFPDDRCVGTLDWLGSRSEARGPVLALGQVDYPDDTEISLEIAPVQNLRRDPSGSWHWSSFGDSIDLAFLLDLPEDAISSISMRMVRGDTMPAIVHVSNGLRRLYLTASGLGDEVLAPISKLARLEYLQTFGNCFTDGGVQVLAALTRLEFLYLEEETLSLRAFEFAKRLPNLHRLGLQDVQISPEELARLRAELPGVGVG